MHDYQGLKAAGRPAGSVRRKPPWRIALVANLKDSVEYEEDDPPDAGAEFDRRETVEAIAGALEAEGHWVHLCQGDGSLPEALLNLRPHICFNIAEGLGGDAREAQVPALCELLDIPYTASRVLANALSLDKVQTKRIWHSMGLPTAPFQEFRTGDEPLDPALTFPLIVKPALEGSGMGVDAHALVADEEALRERVAWVIASYRQPALVESFLPGREFTVGFIGNPGQPARRRPWLYKSHGKMEGIHFFPILEIDSHPSVSPGLYGAEAKSLDLGESGAPAYLCPAAIPDTLRLELEKLSFAAAQAIGYADVARVDLRLGADGQPYLLEINTLPGLNPAVSDLCIMAAAEGLPYQVLISEILYLAAARFDLPFEALSKASPVWAGAASRARQFTQPAARPSMII